LVDRTSASVPIFASIISLINDRRLAAKKSPLGFLKPRLYSDGISGLNDITSGKSPRTVNEPFLPISDSFQAT
ncbi:hypothetical protein C8J57DRAFT_1092628, partial [Mycena rebaudengoi]